jgi:hypothetical protein
VIVTAEPAQIDAFLSGLGWTIDKQIHPETGERVHHRAPDGSGFWSRAQALSYAIVSA